LEALFTKYLAKLRRTSTEFVRDFIHTIDWDRNRLIGIRGARGAGKTTLVLQYLKQKQLPIGQSLYVSLDDLYFRAHRLYDLGEVFVRTGGKLLLG
jgi:predicted AAA+ superfamily ATPase